MNKLEYARKMINFHSRLLIKWTKYIEKITNANGKVKSEIPKGQISLFDIEKKGNNNEIK